MSSPRLRASSAALCGALTVREHHPKPAQRFSRQPRSELRNVAFEVRADEILAPEQAPLVVVREHAFGESAAQPEPIERDADRLERIERRQFEETHAAGERLSRLPQQTQRGRAKQQIAPRARAFSPRPVDETAQGGEQARHAVHFVEDDQPVEILLEVGLGIVEAGAIARRFEVQVHGAPLLGNGMRERRLADLAGAEEAHGRRLIERGEDLGQQPATDHQCILDITMLVLQ